VKKGKSVIHAYINKTQLTTFVILYHSVLFKEET